MPPSLVENFLGQSAYSDTNYHEWKKLALQQWPRIQRQDKQKQQPKAFAPSTSQEGGQRKGRITDKEKTRLMKEGACFICKKKGHLSRQCPEK